MNGEPQMIGNLMHFRSRIDIILECLGGLEQFVIAVKEAFEECVNNEGARASELLAKFIDDKLRRGNKESSEEELETILDKAMVLFRYIRGKDSFEAFYKLLLAKRLLLGRSASIDAEKSILAKLKAECGASFTSKMEGMFKDVEISRELIGSFQESAKYSEECNSVEFNVNVLTSSYWPTFPQMNLSIPPHLEKYEAHFREFYQTKHSGRRLAWQRNLGHALVKARFPKGTKELLVSFVQAVILELFNDSEKLTCSEIEQATQIEVEELKRNLQSLACGKIRILSKTPASRDISDGDVFEMNSEFTAKLYRLKINTIQLQSTPEETSEVNEKVIHDRQYQIDAAIVRVMKTRRTLSHTTLIAELFSVLKFPTRASDLKTRIESLIERDYLERDKENQSLYHYLA